MFSEDIVRFLIFERKHVVGPRKFFSCKFFFFFCVWLSNLFFCIVRDMRRARNTAIIRITQARNKEEITREDFRKARLHNQDQLLTFTGLVNYYSHIPIPSRDGMGWDSWEG